MEKIMDGQLKKFIVTHPIWEIDQYVFPNSNKVKDPFFNLVKPQKVIDFLAFTEKVCERNNIKLLDAKIDFDVNLTILTIQSKTKLQIRNFYNQISDRLKKDFNESTGEICIAEYRDLKKMMGEEIEKIKEVIDA
jgi:hypothetical protein